MELDELKPQWNQVLSALESRSRVAWLTFFDARLVEINENTLLLDFSDSEKFSGNHSFSDSRTKFSPILREIIFDIAGVDLEINW